MIRNEHFLQLSTHYPIKGLSKYTFNKASDIHIYSISSSSNMHVFDLNWYVLNHLVNWVNMGNQMSGEMTPCLSNHIKVKKNHFCLRCSNKH